MLNYIAWLVFSLMLSAVAIPELHSYLRTRALRRQCGSLDTRASCLHVEFYILSLYRAAGCNSVNAIVGSTPESYLYRAPTTASYHYKASNVLPVYLKVNYILYNYLNSLYYRIPNHLPATTPLSLTINTHNDTSSLR